MLVTGFRSSNNWIPENYIGDFNKSSDCKINIKCYYIYIKMLIYIN